MPLLFFILIIILVAQIGFWHTLGAILGAVMMVVLLIMIAAGLLVVAGLMLAQRLTRPRRY